MRRRALLSAAGGAFLATGGCLAPPARGFPPRDAPCPDGVATLLRERRGPVDGAVCHHTRGGSPPVLVVPSRTVVGPGLPDGPDRIRFVVHNRGDHEAGLNPDAWLVARATNEGWEPVRQGRVIDVPLLRLRPGATYSLTMDTDGPPDPDDRRRFDPELHRTGEYAFGIRITVGGPSPRTVACIALFRYVE